MYFVFLFFLQRKSNDSPLPAWKKVHRNIRQFSLYDPDDPNLAQLIEDMKTLPITESGKCNLLDWNFVRLYLVFLEASQTQQQKQYLVTVMIQIHVVATAMTVKVDAVVFFIVVDGVYGDIFRIFL